MICKQALHIYLQQHISNKIIIEPQRSHLKRFENIQVFTTDREKLRFASAISKLRIQLNLQIEETGNASRWQSKVVPKAHEVNWMQGQLVCKVWHSYTMLPWMVLGI